MNLADYKKWIKNRLYNLYNLLFVWTGDDLLGRAVDEIDSPWCLVREDNDLFLKLKEEHVIETDIWLS